MDGRSKRRTGRNLVLFVTKNVIGIGEQKRITVSDMHYDELSRTMIMMVVEDEAERR
jgi:nitrogen regulatory protein PII